MNPGMAIPRNATPLAMIMSPIRSDAVTSPAWSCQRVPRPSAVTATTCLTPEFRNASAAGRVKLR